MGADAPNPNGKSGALLTLYRSWKTDVSEAERLEFPIRETRIDKYTRSDFVGAWDEKSFAIRVRAKDVDKLRQIYDAAVRKNLAIWLGGGGVFLNAGLALMIADRVPVVHCKTMMENDLDRAALKTAAQKTGIEEYLTKAKKKWFALSPKWSGEIKSTVNGEINTQFDVIFWLNPMDQHTNNAGWWTVEQLMQWGEGKGPVVERSKK
jgi:hypothetical protein